MSAELSSVAYKKGNLMRYALWTLVAVSVSAVIYMFIQNVSQGTSFSVPGGYKFSLISESTGNNEVRTNYYVYNDYVLVENEFMKDGSTSRTLTIYNGIDTSGLVLVEGEIAVTCEMNECKEYSKLLDSVRKLLTNKIGREYVRV